MQQIKAIVKGPYEPQDNQVLWIDTSNPDEIAGKVFEGGEWKIVNQDYNIIRPEFADTIASDAAAHIQIRDAIDRGTAFDLVLFKPTKHGYGVVPNLYSRVIGSDSDSVYVFYTGSRYEIISIGVPYSSEQYAGLYAIQKAALDTDAMPGVTYDGNMYLLDDTSEKFICVGGNFVEVTVDEMEKILALNVTDSAAEPGTFVNISYEDLQKLIGLVSV